MKKKEFFIGVDISKSTLDVTILNAEASNEFIHSKFSNSKEGIKKLIGWVKKNTSPKKDKIVFCMEHTGVYGLPLCSILSKLKVEYTLISALEIHRSMGIQRGKSDKKDSRMIAQFAYIRKDSLPINQIPDAKLLKLRFLLAARERFMRCRVMFLNCKELEICLDKRITSAILKDNKATILYLTKRIKLLDKRIENLMKEDEQMNRQYHLMNSIPGIGLQITANVIAYTQAFSSFTDARKFSCYAGIAPFPYQSGSSINGRTKVSQFANKKLKALLSMAAILAIQNDAEIKLYYDRKVKEGKNKMLVINAIRNKIVQRIFAVVKRDTPFVPLAKHVA